MSRPRLLDLFCGEGGASVGYHAAGFDVVGVDIKPQPLYPFFFVQADATAFAVRGCALGGQSFTFDAIHASPPCQAHTGMSNRWRGKGTKADTHVSLIALMRARLEDAGVPWVLENVPGAARFMRDPIVLTGEMFGLRVHRPRLFESNVLILAPDKPAVRRDTIGVYGKAHDGRLLWRRKDGSEQRAARTLERAREAMGMPWASWRGCCEAVPPAYTEFIGRALMQAVTARRASLGD